MPKLERRIDFTPAFDRRNADPKKNYGIHGVEMRWYLIGPRGVIQFVVYTGWMLPQIYEEEAYKSRDLSIIRTLSRPMAADLGYHSPIPKYEYQLKMEECQFFEGGCYYDGSSLAADRILQLLIAKGGEAVWLEMEEYYLEQFTILDIDAEEEDGPLRLPEGDGDEQLRVGEVRTGYDQPREDRDANQEHKVQEG